MPPKTWTSRFNTSLRIRNYHSFERGFEFEVNKNDFNKHHNMSIIFYCNNIMYRGYDEL